MAKENLFDKIKKNLKGDDDDDQDQDQATDQSACESVHIDGKKITVPKYIAINLKQQKNK